MLSGPETKSNVVRYNQIYANDSLGIAVINGAQNGAVPPLLLTATTSVIYGYLAPAFGTVDIYRADQDPSGSGEGREFLASGQTDQSGEFTIAVSNLLSGEFLTAIATDNSGNSSAFSVNKQVDITLDIKDPLEELPESVELSQNFPNPFNPETTIAYQLARSTMVEVSVFNSLGQQVMELVNKEQLAGSYSVIWDGVGSDGTPLASGVYFYRLRTESGEHTKKMLLLK
jgi:hypothetical protein